LALCSLCALVLAARAAAIEISLEENRAEAGTIGYVDMERVFKAHPETSRAKDDFVLVIKDKKDIVALKRTELAAIKAKLNMLRDKERDLSARVALECPLPPPSPVAVVSVSTVQVPAVSVSSSVETRQAAPVAAVVSSSSKPVYGPFAPQNQGPVPMSASLSLPATAQASPAAAAPLASAATQQIASPLANAATNQAVVPLSSPATAQASVPVTPANRDMTDLSNLRSSITMLDQDVSNRERELADFKTRSERELVDMEAKRSEMILGKIYMVLRRLAAEENISVVVDKKSILYGYSAVDLTDKLLERLK